MPYHHNSPRSRVKYRQTLYQQPTMKATIFTAVRKQSWVLRSVSCILLQLNVGELASDTCDEPLECHTCNSCGDLLKSKWADEAS